VHQELLQQSWEREANGASLEIAHFARFLDSSGLAMAANYYGYGDQTQQAAFDHVLDQTTIWQKSVSCGLQK